MNQHQKFQDTPVDIKIKLAGLWASVMFCYIYGDYFGLYRLGDLQDMINGVMGPLGPITQTKLAAVSLIMIPSSLMIFLSLVLKPVYNRFLNLFFGVFYTLLMVVTLPGAWLFYILYGIIEIGLTLLIIGYAWRWGRAGGILN